MKKFFLLLFIIILCFSLKGQYYGKNKIQPQKIEWKKIQTLHFDLYYPGFDDSFGKIAALTAEEAYYHLRDDFKTPLKQRIPIIFYSTHQEFEVTNIIPNLLSEGVGGFTESMHNRVAMPFSGSYKEMELTLTHELTHAYVNELGRDKSLAVKSKSLPFWLAEGLPEFLSVNGSSVYNNMFIMDLVYNNSLINLNEVGGYYAYREGESFLKFIEDEYGRNKVMDLFYSARVADPDFFAKKIFNSTFMQLQLKWENHLKRQYFPVYNDYDVPSEAFQKLTDSQKDGSSMNMTPRFAPDGIHYAFFSNKNITSGLYLADRLELKQPQEFIRSGVSGIAEEFHFQKNNSSFTPDSTQIAFAVNTSFGDKVHFMDINTHKILRSVCFDSIPVIFEIDISPDGSKMAFSAIKDTYCDIYVYDLQSEQLLRLTSDRYYDAAPRWSPDGTRLAFQSERAVDHLDNRHIFSNSINNIYYYDFNRQEFFKVTHSEQDCTQPVWNAQGNRLFYITDDGTASNIKIIDLQNGSIADITRVISGVQSFDLSPDNQNLLFSCFYKGAWDVYLANVYWDSLNWMPATELQSVQLKDDFWQVYDLDRIRYYGKTNLTFKKPGPKRQIDPQLAERFDIKIDYGPDSTIVEHNRRADRKPGMPNEPQIMPYKTKMKIDYFWGGLAYSSSGTYAMLDLWASDILGNHSVYSSVDVSGSLENSSILLQYLNLEHLNDYGGGVFYLNDETIYQIYYNDNSSEDYFRKRVREYGLFSAYNHPFDAYWRVELQISLLRQMTFRDWWLAGSGQWLEEYLDPDFAAAYGLKTKEEAWQMVPRISLVHDNALYGSVGPVSGWKGFLSLQQAFSTDQPHTMAYADLRKYSFFAKRYCWANRFLAGWSYGDQAAEFDLTGFFGIRGFDDDDYSGKNKLLLSTELRVPLIDEFSLSFPLPLRIRNVRGSAFVDLGAVWDKADDFEIASAGKLVTPRMGFGYGPRLNMGFFILKFDIAWQTDLENISKPRYYLWLIEDF